MSHSVERNLGGNVISVDAALGAIVAIDDSAEVSKIIQQQKRESVTRWADLIAKTATALNDELSGKVEQTSPARMRRPRKSAGSLPGDGVNTLPPSGVTGREGLVSAASSPSPSNGAVGAPPTYGPLPLELPQIGDSEYIPREVVIDKNGLPRQAGVSCAEGEWVKSYRRRAQENLFIFLKGVLGRNFLTPHFHRGACRFIQKCPPFRKLVLMPREHAKTAIVSGGLPPHILIQSAESNIYFPGLEGSECRILLAGETANMAQKNLRVVKSVFEENKLFRAFWPNRVWENANGSKQWNNDGIIIPRKEEWPDPSIRAIGVGGAITGARPNVMIKDDLVTFDAANSNTIMQEAIDWHKASRALLDKYEIESGLQSLEFIVGTRWAVWDLYSEIIEHDPSVEVIDGRFHKIINDGRILWPEKYTQKDIEQLQREHGSMFYLLYLNSVADPELTDFDMSLVRAFEIKDGEVVFEEDERDVLLGKKVERSNAKASGLIPPPVVRRGQVLNSVLMQRFAEASGGIRVKAA